ncbi:MAG TPA: VIT1/CCC1 transporter family protein, partial [Acidimicrobiales bacterium]|nr:VIT1/CCC1 transporter family protein [Acidimicrobiales bacterium]
EAASQELDGPTLRELARQEAAELGLVFRARGLPADGADGTGGTGVEVTGTDVVGSATGAAGLSFVTFASGAAIPILPFLLTSGTAALAAAAVIVGVALFATGATVGLLTGGPLLGRGLRQLGIGAAAAVVTYGLGRVLGTAIG